MKYVSLFSGIEAASVAWEPLGWEAVAFSEIEPFPCEVLKTHYPNVPNLGDITKIDWSNYGGTVDLIVGGSPCQSFSVAGKREGLKGASGLMFEYIRAVREVLPRYFVWENVPGSLTSEQGAAFGQLITEMDELGYSLAWRVLDAQHFGVPQRRRRVFLIGCLGNAERAAEILFESESLCWDSPSSKDKRKELTTKVGESVNDCRKSTHGIGFREGGFGQYVEGETGTLKASGGVLGGGSETFVVEQPLVMAPAFSKRPAQQIPNRQDGLCYAITTGQPPSVLRPSVISIPYVKTRRPTQKDGIEKWEQVELAPTINCFDVGDVRATTVVWQEELYENHPNDSRVTGPHDTCPTITTRWGTGGGNVPLVSDMYIVRRLTPIECERLQGFPDGWTTIEWRGKPVEECPDSHRYKALGNSMAVPVMRWIGARINEVDN